MKHEAMEAELETWRELALAERQRADALQTENARLLRLESAQIEALSEHIARMKAEHEAALARARAEAVEEAAQELDERAARLWALAKAHPEHEEMFSSGAADMEVMARAIRRLSETGGVGGASPAGTVCSPSVEPLRVSPPDGASPPSRTHGEG